MIKLFIEENLVIGVFLCVLKVCCEISQESLSWFVPPYPTGLGLCILTFQNSGSLQTCLGPLNICLFFMPRVLSLFLETEEDVSVELYFRKISQVTLGTSK